MSNPEKVLEILNELKYEHPRGDCEAPRPVVVTEDLILEMIELLGGEID